MRINAVIYRETNSLRLNTFLIFYLYVVAVIIIANILPVLPLTYFIFIFFGVVGICILLMKYHYQISLNKDSLMLAIKIPFKIVLLKLKVADIKTAEEINWNNYVSVLGITRIEAGYSAYIFNKKKQVKFTMKNGKIFIVSLDDPQKILGIIYSLKNRTS
jgi:hypothetical protein